MPRSFDDTVNGQPHCGQRSRLPTGGSCASFNVLVQLGQVTLVAASMVGSPVRRGVGQPRQGGRYGYQCSLYTDAPAPGKQELCGISIGEPGGASPRIPPPG